LDTQYFKDKVFLITGSTQGIGRELALLALEHGAKVCLNGRTEEKAEKTLSYFQSFPNKVIYVAADITKKEEVQQLIEATTKAFGRLDVLVANAGLSSFAPFHTLSLPAVETVINSNLYGSIYGAHYALPELIKSKGAILLVSSLAGLHGIPDYAPYSIGKMALTALWQSLRKELFQSGVFVGISYVGFTENDREKRAYDANGNLIQIQDRKRFKPATQRETAQGLLNQIAHRKPLKVHSNLGKMAYIMGRFFPGLVHRIFLKNYLKAAK
jgi:dehydrogenase/reductase SDR family protein 7B